MFDPILIIVITLLVALSGVLLSVYLKACGDRDFALSNASDLRYKAHVLEQQVLKLRHHQARDKRGRYLGLIESAQ